jgi:hypothetical protein
MRRIHTDDQVREMAEKYRAGASLPQLAREYGGSHVTIRNVLVRNGVETRKPGRSAWRHFTPEEQAEIVRSWHAGESQSSIAKRLAVTQPIVSKFLVSNGIEPVHRPRNLRGDQHPSWRGGVTMIHGYRAVKVARDDPFASMRIDQGYVMEHRLVMARALGRPLEKYETVHHINGDKQDNRLENLQLRQGQHGKGVVFRCQDCGSHNVAASPLT